MGKLGRDILRRKLERHLAQGVDEAMISLVSAVVAVQSGNPDALGAVKDLPPEAVGAELGSAYYIPPWSLETLVNELLAVPKRKGFGVVQTRILDFRLFHTLRTLHGMLVRLENAEDGVFLDTHDVFYEMARIAQRQFPWQRGVANAPHIYRSMLLYGTGTARDFFEVTGGLALPDFVKVGVYLTRTLEKRDLVSRDRDLSSIGIAPAVREAALAKFAIPHTEARTRAAAMRAGRRHTGYRPSILRDFPVIAFGDRGERLRAPLPDLVMHRATSGLYLDVVRGGAAVWTDIGRRFEGYVLEYLQAMMSPYKVAGEVEYGPKKTRHRTPDVLVSGREGVVAVVECKAKHMSFDARYADDPVTAASIGFDELAKGIYQIWRFFAHARRGLTGVLRIAPDCQGVVVTADSWLTMASRQAEQVVAAARTLADAEGGIEEADRREIAFCQIDDVEFTLQHGTADSFLTACREVASGDKKGFMLSVAHAAEQGQQREYPFKDRLSELLPWMSD